MLLSPPSLSKPKETVSTRRAHFLRPPLSQRGAEEPAGVTDLGDTSNGFCRPRPRTRLSLLLLSHKVRCVWWITLNAFADKEKMHVWSGDRRGLPQPEMLPLEGPHPWDLGFALRPRGRLCPPAHAHRAGEQWEWVSSASDRKEARPRGRHPPTHIVLHPCLCWF